MAKRKALGRGLGALLPEVESQAGEEVRQIPIHRISPNPDQPRKQFDPDRLEELAASLRVHGMLQPVVVRPHADGYHLIVGERRWRAAQRAGMERIPALVIEPRPEELLVMALVENLQRDDLAPLEEAGAFQALQARFGLTQEAIAQSVGRSRAAVANAVRLLKLPASVRELLAAGALTAGHARAILTLDGQARQADLARRVVRQALSVRQTEALARRLARPAPPARPPVDSRSASLADLGERIGRTLGSRVKVVPRKRGARFIIDCAADEEIESLIDALGLR